jgi:integrase
MAQRLTDTIVKNLAPPAKASKVHYDTETTGFGCRVTAAGARSFILNYTTRGGRERRFTIGQFPTWRTAAARAEAVELKKAIAHGGDPLADLEADREAPTVADLCERFEQEHLPKKKASTQRDYRQQIRCDILPAMKHLKVADVTFSDVDALHRTITKRAPYHANRVVALLSKMFSLSIKWKWRGDNPCKFIERNDEQRRERYLEGDELVRLTAALAEHNDQQAANIFRLLMLTGARKGEVLSARWSDLNLETGVWSKPSASTKSGKPHRVPLSAPAMQLFSELWEHAAPEAVYVFPGQATNAHRTDINGNWTRLCKAANIEDARIHDLRHTYASLLVSAGLSLPIIGRLLGHTQPATTARYSHLMDDPLRAATETVGAIVMPSKPPAEVVPMKRDS